MRFSRLYFLLIVFILTACDEVYRKWEKESFANRTWRRGQELIFTPKINDITTTYELVLGVRHIFGARISTLPVVVRMVAPSGKESTNQFTLRLTSEEGRRLADCAGDLCDLEVPVGELAFTEPGEYRFIITHQSRNEVVRGIMEFGLILRETE